MYLYLYTYMEVYAYKYILKAFLVLVNTIPTKTCKITEAYYTHLKKNRLFVMFKLALFCYNKIFFSQRYSPAAGGSKYFCCNEK